MRPVLAVIVMLFPVTVVAAEDRSSDFLASVMLDMSQQMAFCAGRQDAVADVSETHAKPNGSDDARRIGKSFEQCALFIRTRYVNRESKVAYQKQVAEEVAVGKRLFMALMKEDDQRVWSDLLGECRRLDNERGSCEADEKQFLGKGQ